MMTYKEYKDAKQEEFNKLPIFYAFGNKQLEDALKERGYTLEDGCKAIYKLGGTGGFYLKSDSAIIREYFSKDRDVELREMMKKDHDFAKDAFVYEMLNHEYPINWQGDWDVCSCFGTVEYSDDKYADDYLKELGFDDTIVGIYMAAIKEVRKACEW